MAFGRRKKAFAYRSQDVRVFHAPPLSLRPRSSWQGGHFVPRCIPQTSGFAAWTPPEALRLLDFRPGGVSLLRPPDRLFRHRLRPGEPSCPPWTSRPGRFHQPLDPRPWGEFALPPDPHRPGVRRHGPAAGLSRPCTTNRGVPPRCPCLPAEAPAKAGPTLPGLGAHPAGSLRRA